MTSNIARLLLAGACVLSLAACNATVGAGGFSITPGGAVSQPAIALAAEAKTLAVIENAADALALATEALVQGGQLKGPNAATARTVLQRIDAVLKLAEHAYDMGNAADLQTQLGQLSALIAQGVGLLHPSS